MHAGKERDEPRIARLSNLFVDTADRWFPDAYVFVLAGVALVGLAAVLHGASPLSVCRRVWRRLLDVDPLHRADGLCGHRRLHCGDIAGGRKDTAVARAPPCRRPFHRRFCRRPEHRPFLIELGAQLDFLGPARARDGPPARTDSGLSRASAAAYLGLGCGFTLGLSSSAAQLQANPASIPSNLMPITGVIGFSQTIFTWQNAFAVVVLTLVSALVCYLTAPTGRFVRTAEDLGVNLGTGPGPREDVQHRPGDYLANSPVLSVLIVVLGLGWICMTFSQGNPILLLSELNTYNLVFLLLGILLHGTPRSLADAFSRAVPSKPDWITPVLLHPQRTRNLRCSTPSYPPQVRDTP
jgi:short-chain fatty acids transporter